MKKSLVLAMAMVLGVTASAYAANPFSDVPAGHWAYDSLAKLADTGVIDGYPDGTFKGDETITRYEAAQITARAMAKGANVDKLAAEFSSELEALGVKVAALEKKADNVKITGELRYHYKHSDSEGGAEHVLRSRLWVNGQVNDDWAYTGMLQNEQNLKDNADNSTLGMKRAYINGKVGGVAVQAGRWNEIPNTGNVLDATLDGIKLEYGNKVKVSAMAAKGIEDLNDYDDNGDELDATDRLYVVGVSGTIGVVDAYANYFKTHGNQKREIYNVGVELPVAADLTLGAEYMHGKLDDVDDYKKNGYAFALNYKGAEAEEPGTWGVHAQYLYQPRAAYLVPTTDATTFDEKGYKGWNIGAEYSFAKNIVGMVNYYDTKSIEGDEKDKVIFSELYFYF